MTPEGKAKVKIRQWIKDNMPGSWRVSPRGGPFGKTGCPDDLICWQGVFIAIEIKSAEGDPTSAQINELKLIRAAGGIAAVVRGYDVSRLIAIKNAALVKICHLQ
jgi:hypothetical protein